MATVSIVGRPNVGKSALFNRIARARIAIVFDQPGVTRDRVAREVTVLDKRFMLVDTGGIEPSTDSEILLFMREQAQIAIDAATVIILVTDIRTGVTAADQDVATMLQRSRKPVVLAVNKADSTGATDPTLYEFYSLGLGDPIAVSAVHGHGTGDLLDACFEYFPEASRTSASPLSSTASSVKSASSSQISPVPPVMRSTRRLKTNTGNMSSLTPPVSAGSPAWRSAWRSFPSCAPSLPSSVRTSA